MFQRTWNDARQTCARFFFSPETPFGLALIRIYLPLVMMGMVFPRWPYTRELYSSDGATAQLGLGYGYPNFLPEFSGEIAVALNSLLVLALFCTMIGWHTRWSLLITFVLYPYFSLLDSISTLTKYTVITTHLVLLLSVSQCGAIWSVDAWLARRKGKTLSPLPVSSTAWPRRLVQLMIGTVYFGAAITKMNTPTFLSGDQLQLWMLTHINFRHPLGELLSMYPVLLKSMAYVTIVWEMTFIFLVWRSMWRPWVLAIGVTFHFMTTLTLGLFIFPLTCYAAYLSFVDEEDFLAMRRAARTAWARTRWLPQISWQQFSEQVTSWVGSADRWRKPAAVAFPAMVVLSMAGGVGIEYWNDPYQVRRPEGPLSLKPLDPEFAARVVTPTERIRDKDKFFAIDTGLLLVGDLLADRRRVFRHGDKMIAQCHLVPPHEDMWIDCQVLDENNRLIDRLGSVATREAFRINFEYPITTEIAPGDYTLVFGTAGREVLRKRITIVGSSPAVAAH